MFAVGLGSMPELGLVKVLNLVEHKIAGCVTKLLCLFREVLRFKLFRNLLRW